MLVEGLSLLTALCYALSAVFVRKGLKGSNPSSANLMNALVQVSILTTLLAFNLPAINWHAVLFFALSGILASGLGRLFNYMSVERLGVAMSSALIGVTPLISTVLAILFLGEPLSLPVFLGAVLVVVGVYSISGTGDGLNHRDRSLLIPFLSATFYGFSSVVRKAGLNIQPDALLGAQVGAASGMLSFLIYLTLTGNLGEIRADRRSLGYFLASGITVSVAWIAMFNAMRMGTVAVVTTLMGANPLFSILLSWLVLRGQENLGGRVIAGSVAIVAGVALVSLF